MNSFALQKPPCFNTWRFLNLRVLKQGDLKISVFKPRRFLNLHVLQHGDSKISIEERKLNLLRKKFQQHAITYTGH